MTAEGKPRVDLRTVFLGLQEQMIASLSTAREIIYHSGAKGDASELQWANMLNTYLPLRYRADKAFVLDCEGNISEQIDVVVYDRQYSPFLFNQNNAKYVAAESVYAVFEVKQDLSARNLKYAGEKGASVRALRRTSAPIQHAGGRYEPKTPPTLLAGILALGSEWNPPFGDRFLGSLTELRPEERLDLGCSLRYGAFEPKYLESGSPELRLSTPETALIFFFLKLLGQLQHIGTVAAIDFDEYGRVL